MSPRETTGREVAVAVVAGGLLLTAALLSDRLVSRTEVPDATDVALEPPPPIVPRDRYYGVAVPSDSVVWLAGNLGKIIRSDDGGSSWRTQESGTEVNLQDIAAWDSRRAVAVGNDGIVLRTTDGGGSWSTAEAPRSRIVNKLLRVRVYPGGRAFAVGAGGMIIASEDGGESWTRRSGREDVAWNDVAFSGPERGWVVGEFGRILRTGDGGESWQEVDAPIERSLMAVAFRDPRRGVAVGLDGLVIVTGDGGRQWRVAESGTGVHLYDVAWDGARWTVAGDGGLVLVGESSGERWSVRSLGEREAGWHTEVARIADGWILVGATQGSWRDGAWNLFAE